MFRPVIKSVAPRLATRQFVRRNHGHSYGPSEPLTKPVTIGWVSIGTLFAGLFIYDAYFADKPDGLSSISRWVTPSVDEQVRIRDVLRQHEEEAVAQGLKAREQSLLLLGPTASRHNQGVEVFRTNPVPDSPSGEASPGQLLDLNSLDERRARPKFLADKKTDDESQ